MGDSFYYQLYEPHGSELDPNAVNELFENVVYGEGIDVGDGAQHRRLQAEKRRLEMERRSLENAVKRAQAEKDRQFFNTLIMSGPDRPAPKPDNQSLPASQPSTRSGKIQIPFTAADRSRIPRKTRQQWLDKFNASCEVAFPGALAALDPSLILSLEQSVYQTTKTATAYIGAWMNKIHSMKLSPSLGEFVSPSVKEESSVVKNNQRSCDAIKDRELLPSSSPASSPIPRKTSQEEDNHQNSDAIKNADLLSASLPTLSSNPGKASLLGKELPFSLFGSDDEDEAAVSDSSPPADRLNETASANAALVSVQESSKCNESELFESTEASPSVANGKVDKGPSHLDADVCEVGVDNHSMPGTSSVRLERCKSVEQNGDTETRKEQDLRDETKPNKIEQEVNTSDDLPIKMNTDSVQCDDHKQEENVSKKRSQRDGNSDHPPLEKKQKRFDPECKTFIRDVVAAHLRLRFGKELTLKVIVSIQSRVVEKILSDQNWTLERLRRHKRAIDELAERYVNRIRRERKSSKE